MSIIRPQRARLTALAVVFVVALVAAIAFGLRYAHARDVSDARGAALSAAKSYATTMFGYQTDNIDAHITASKDVVTGAARDQYDQIVTDSNLAAEVKKRGIVSDASIQDAGVVSNSSDHAVVLIFMNQSVTSGDNQLVRVEPSRLQYSMRVESGKWKIYEIEVFTDDSVRKSIQSAPSSPAPSVSTPSPTPVG